MIATVATGPVLSGFGWRMHPITFTRRFHYGVDRIGDGNYSPVDGMIVWARYDTIYGSGFGLVVGIRETANPSVIWWLAHFLSLDPGIRVGAKVKRGQYLGLMGATGAATGRHVHVERRVNGATRPLSGIATDPEKFYASGGGSAGGFTARGEREQMKVLKVGSRYYETTAIACREISATQAQALSAGGWWTISVTAAQLAVIAGVIRGDLDRRNAEIAAAVVAVLPPGDSRDSAAIATAVIAALEPKFAAVNANIDDQPTDFKIVPA